MSKVLIIGGGAAGMMASVFAARNGHEVHIFEKMKKQEKSYTLPARDGATSPMHAMNFFEEAGVELKVERGNRVFPKSDRSADVLDGLRRQMKQAGVQVHLHTEAADVITEEGRAAGVCLSDGRHIMGDAVIVATGGISYASTGSTGDGYRFAEKLGHKVTQRRPALVPFNIREHFVKELQGLSLKNVEISVRNGEKELYREFGEMLFTHFGVSGPLILTASSFVGGLAAKQELTLVLDLKPALTLEQLDQRILRDFEENHKKQYKNVLNGLFPAKLVPVMIMLSQIPPEKKIHEITKEERKELVNLTKHLVLHITGTGDFAEAVITQGGIVVKEVNPSTMESRRIKGLYFAGEVLDLDALTGGFNLQIAWSTGYLAGSSIP